MQDLLSEHPTRHPGYLLALIEWAMADPAGAFAATIQDNPPHQTGGDGDQGPHRWYGWSREARTLADLWDLQAGASTPRGKKPPRYPRPSMGRRSRPVSPFAAEYEQLKRARRD